jgi:hypothetical protein
MPALRRDDDELLALSSSSREATSAATCIVHEELAIDVFLVRDAGSVSHVWRLPAVRQEVGGEIA